MKLNMVLVAAATLLLLGGCCSFASDDEFPPGIDLKIQFLDVLCVDNLFDEDGPLLPADISFEVQPKFGGSTENRVITPNEVTDDGTFIFFLFSNDLVANENNQSAGELFIERTTGERDILSLFTETINGDCGDSFLNLTAVEFKGERIEVGATAVMELKLE